MPKQRRILIVNCRFDELRIPIRRRMRIPQSMTPAYLAGLFSTRLCDVKLYDEIYSGPLEDEALLSFPHMLVLTGLNTSFDRMLHITAYVRTKYPSAIVVAGGPAIRAIPRYAANFFDYCCTGDIEQLADVIVDALGVRYLAESFQEHGWVIPRYELVYWMKLLAYVESSRNCYFRCGFCSLTAEKAKYQTYPMEYLRQQFMALGHQRFIHFLDNNFASNDPQFVSDRFGLLMELKSKGLIHKYAAEVTSDFFMKERNLKQAAQTGCGALFCGVESFEKEALLNFKKYQNTCLPQVEMIRECLQAGIAFHYGLVFDLTSRAISDLKAELEFIFENPDISLPAFTTLAIPLLKSPFFYECLERDLFLPNIKVRDLDGATLCLKTVDPLPDAVRFVRNSQNLKGYRCRVIRHTVNFYRKYRKMLLGLNMTSNLFNSLALCAPTLSNLGVGSCLLKGHRKGTSRTFIGSTEPLDSIYRPSFRVDSRYRRHFTPTMLTDSKGRLAESLHPDLSPAG